MDWNIRQKQPSNTHVLISPREQCFPLPEWLERVAPSRSSVRPCQDRSQHRRGNQKNTGHLFNPGCLWLWPQLVPWGPPLLSWALPSPLASEVFLCTADNVLFYKLIWVCEIKEIHAIKICQHNHTAAHGPAALIQLMFFNYHHDTHNRHVVFPTWNSTR